MPFSSKTAISFFGYLQNEVERLIFGQARFVQKLVENQCQLFAETNPDKAFPKAEHRDSTQRPCRDAFLFGNFSTSFCTKPFI